MLWACVVLALFPLALLAAGQAPPAVFIRRDESGALQLVDGNVTVAVRDAVVRAELSAAVSTQRSEISFLAASVFALDLDVTAALSAQRSELSSLAAAVSAMRAVATTTPATTTTTRTTTTTTTTTTTMRTLSFTTTIRTLDSIGEVGYYSSLQLTAAGNPVVSYHDGSNSDLKLAVCGDATCASTPTIRTLASSGNVGLSTSLQLTAAGHPVVSFYDDTNDDLKVALCLDSTCTAAPIIRTLDSNGTVGTFTSLQLTAAGNPVVSYFDFTNGNLKLAVCLDATCANVTIRTLDSTGTVGEYTSLQLTATGNAVVSYFDATNTDLKLALCGDPACTSANITLRTLDSNGTVGVYTSLQLTAAGNPIVSYYDAFNANLKLAVCSDPLCAAPPTIRTVDSPGAVGQFSSLQLRGGNPVISYAGDPLDLKLAVCGDATCSAPPTIRTLTNSGITSMYTSLRLTAAGNAVISYFDSMDANLKLIVVS
jgi:trimeric autotransporter adhesin